MVFFIKIRPINKYRNRQEKPEKNWIRKSDMFKIEIGDLLLIEEKSLACGFTYYKPDLLIFQFGVNESENLARKAYITQESYKKNLEDVISRFQKILPDTNILLISPIERISKNEKGIYQTMPEILFIRDTQKAIEYNTKYTRRN